MRLPFLFLLFAAVNSVKLSHYQILGVSAKSSCSQIKKAYRRLALELHPDKLSASIEDNEREQLKEMFLSVQEAYEVLSDSEKRLQYDYSLEGVQYDNTAETEPDRYSEGPLETFIKTRRLRVHFTASFDQKKVPDLLIRLDVPLEKTFATFEKDQKYFHRRLCPHCQGRGGECRACALCAGSGRAVHYASFNNGFYESTTTTRCNNCSGSGCVVVAKCSFCGGSKFEMLEEVLPISLHAGFRNGFELRYQARGHQSSDGRTGDVLVKCMYEMPAGWTLDQGTGLLTHTIAFPLEDLLGGLDRSIRLISGETMGIRIRPNISIMEALSGVEIIADRWGMVMNESGERGRLVIRAEIDFSVLTMESLRRALHSSGLTESDEMYHRVLLMFSPVDASMRRFAEGGLEINEEDVTILDNLHLHDQVKMNVVESELDYGGFAF